MSFAQVIKSTPLLVEGSMYDRLKRLAADYFDPELAHLGLIYSETGRLALKTTYFSYIQSAQKSNLPIILFTPTWRCHNDRVKRSQLKNRDVNVEAVQFVSSLRNDPEISRATFFLGGLIGCRNDCYDPKQALTPSDAQSFHAVQIEQLAKSKIDFLFASTLPAVSEAVGIAKAMCAASHPYILSFVIDHTGAVLDGTPLDQAIRMVDNSVKLPPLGYFVNCVHPDVAFHGLKNLEGKLITDRLIGFQGNTSRRDPRELDALTELDTQDPDDFADSTIKIHKVFGVNALGGCCGSGPEHIRSIGERLKANC